MQEQQIAPPVETVGEEAPRKGLFRRRPRGPGKKRSKKRIVATVAVVLLALLFLSRCFGGGRREPGAASAYVTTAADRGDIHVALSGSGTLEPADSYTVTTLISGEILAAAFEEGDMVEEDQVLYQVDSSDLSNSIERAELALTQSQTNYNRRQEALEDLNVKTPVAGTVTELLVEAGDSVTAGQVVARVEDRDTMVLEVPFPADDAARLSVGQSAQVVLDSTFETLTGTVTAVSGADQVLTGNRIVRDVTIEVPNPGALTTATTATASVGEYACTAAAPLAYRDAAEVTAPASGDVAGLSVREGDRVGRNQVLLSIQSNDVADTAQSAYSSLRDAEIALENQYDQLENYTIKSPIHGTVVEKNYKTGDTLESGKSLCTIYDLSYLTMTLYVDELDISQVEVGQEVLVTAEAVEGETFTGVVTTVSIKGSTAGGVTTYPVTVRIDDTGDLLPGMNVDCEIQVADVTGVVRIPAGAVSRGNQVLVQTGENTGEVDQTTGLPEGFTYREVTIGVSDGDWVEITSGLEAGDTVAYIPASTNDFLSILGGMMIGGADGPAAGAPPAM